MKLKRFIGYSTLAFVLFSGTSIALLNTNNSITPIATNTQKEERFLELSDEDNIVDSYVGWYNSAIVVEDENGNDQLYYFGSFKDGTGGKYLRPTKITVDGWDNSNSWQIENVELGRYFTMVDVEINGQDYLYTWGRDQAGALGNGQESDNFINSQNAQAIFPATPGEWDGKEIIGLANSTSAGNIIVSDPNAGDSVYSIGSSSNGHNGGGTIYAGANHYVPTKISLRGTDGTTIVTDPWETEFFGGEQTFGLVTRDSSNEQHFYMWGDGSFGVSDPGVADIWHSLLVPTEIDLDSKGVVGEITDMYMGQYAAGLITEDPEGNQRVYAWGKNNDNMFGGSYGTYNDIVEIANNFTEGTFAYGHTFKDISVGGSNIFFVTEDAAGDDYIWASGSNGVGQLGNGKYGDAKGGWVQVSPEIFRDLEILSVEIIQGTVNVKAKNNEGENLYYYWGDNRYGSVGTNDTNNTYYPWEITQTKNNNLFNEENESIENFEVIMGNNPLSTTFDVSFDLMGRTGEGIDAHNAYSVLDVNSISFYTTTDNSSRVPNVTKSNDYTLSEEVYIENGDFFRTIRIPVTITSIPYGSYESLYVKHSANDEFVKINDGKLNISNDFELSKPEFNFHGYDPVAEELQFVFELMDAFGSFDPDSMIIQVDETRNGRTATINPEFRINEIVEEDPTGKEGSFQYIKKYEVTIENISEKYSYDNWTVSLTGEEEDFITVTIVDEVTGEPLAPWTPNPAPFEIPIETLIWLILIIVIFMALIQTGASALLYAKITKVERDNTDEIEKGIYASMTRGKLRELLDDEGIEYDPSAPKAHLVEIIWQYEKEIEDKWSEKDYEEWKDFDFATLDRESLVEWLEEHRVAFKEEYTDEELAKLANKYYHEDDYENWKDFDFGTLETDYLIEWLAEHGIKHKANATHEELAELANKFYHNK